MFCLWALPVFGGSPLLQSWSASEIALLKTLRLANLSPVAADWRNPLAGNRAAAQLGRRLFHDARLSGDGSLSCASCHAPRLHFQDGRATAQGRNLLKRNTPSLLGVAHRHWLYRDGRKDSLWAQALEPIESPDEMNGSRSSVARLVLGDAVLRTAYETLFGALVTMAAEDVPIRASPLGGPAERAAWATLGVDRQRLITEVFVNVGIAIAAFEATLKLRESRFDGFVNALLSGDTARANRLLSRQEQRGLRRFISGDAGCVSCHLGPRFTNDAFHNIGTGPGLAGGFDRGRLAAHARLLKDEFNCDGVWSRAGGHCTHLQRLGRVEVVAQLNGAFRTPGLRDLTLTAPYMHDGRFESLEQVIEYYRSPPDKAHNRHELPILGALSDADAEDIIAFLKTLSRGQ